MKDFFYGLAEEIQVLLQPGERFLAYLEAEDSDFVRFNHNRVRQAGQVHQIELTLDLIEGQRHSGASCHLSGDLSHDLAFIRDLLLTLREQRRLLPEDPHLLYATEVISTEDIQENALPDSSDTVRDIIGAADGLDLVGFLASGTLYRGFANSLGQRNWYQRANFNFDWSCYLHSDKAVKSAYAGVEWCPNTLQRKMDEARQQIALLGKTPTTIEPGRYRVYVAPAALKEIFWLLSWDSFGLKSHRTRQTAFLKMIEAGRMLHPSITLMENNRQGIAPLFTDSGFIKPERVRLIDRGAYGDCLVGPRSGREYQQPVNCGDESPQSLELMGGTLPSAEVLHCLDTGVYINNLWYLNFSDRNNACITGMTRYASFWVEGGRPVAPLNVMRFDESLYTMLGDKLLGLTQEREFMFDPDTYGRRSVNSQHLPGALVQDFSFTL